MKRRSYELLEVVTVGAPFCAFKVLTGVALFAHPWAAPLGWALVVLGALDGLVNVANLGSLVAGRPRVLGVCVCQLVIHRLRPGGAWDDLGIAVDVMLSFVLVAVMIGFDLLTDLSRSGLQVWSVAVVLNVLGAGFGRLSSSLGSLKQGGRARGAGDPAP